MMFIREGSLLGVLGEVPKEKMGGGVGGGWVCASAREWQVKSQGGVWSETRLDCSCSENRSGV